MRLLAEEDRAASLKERVRVLDAKFRGAAAQDVLHAAMTREFPGALAVLSSFGAEAAVTLHMAAQIDPAVPVLFLETDRHFPQTLQYRDQLVSQLGLTDVRVLAPVGAQEADPTGDLWRTDPDRCCAIRKVRPLADATGGFAALVTGRKRVHGGERIRLPVFEVIDGGIRVNPLADWTVEDVDAYYEEHRLPRHPLVEHGFPSIGCWPCTRPIEGGGVREGRWAGSAKTECGIHRPRHVQPEVKKAS